MLGCTCNPSIPKVDSRRRSLSSRSSLAAQVQGQPGIRESFTRPTVQDPGRKKREGSHCKSYPLREVDGSRIAKLHPVFTEEFLDNNAVLQTLCSGNTVTSEKQDRRPRAVEGSGKECPSLWLKNEATLKSKCHETGLLSKQVHFWEPWHSRGSGYSLDSPLNLLPEDAMKSWHFGAKTIRVPTMTSRLHCHAINLWERVCGCSSIIAKPCNLSLSPPHSEA